MYKLIGTVVNEDTSEKKVVDIHTQGCGSFDEIVAYEIEVYGRGPWVYYPQNVVSALGGRLEYIYVQGRGFFDVDIVCRGER